MSTQAQPSVRETVQPRCAVVIVAAGSGERLGRGIPKAAVMLDGEALLTHCLRAVSVAELGGPVCVVIPRDHAELAALSEEFGASHVPGGANRAESVRNALAALPHVEHVLIHDAARPLTPAAVFHRVLRALEAGADAAIPAVPVVDTIKEAQPSPDSGFSTEQVLRTVDRERLRAVQTPQGFNLAALRSAHASSEAAGLTDDAMAMEAAGYAVGIVAGSAHSLKITTETDLLFAHALVAAAQPASPQPHIEEPSEQERL